MPLARGLTTRQRWLSLLALVAVPYVRAKAERAYTARRGGDAARLGLLDADEASDSAASAEAPQSAPAAQSRLERAFMAVYPWAHAAIEGGSFLHGCVGARSCACCVGAAAC